MSSSTNNTIPDKLSFLYRPIRYIEYGRQTPVFDTLPNELLSEIFKLALPRREVPEFKRMWRQDFKIADFINMMTAPLVFSAVCRRWRQAALSTRALWTCFAYQAYSDKVDNVDYKGLHRDMVFTWLERSGRFPLTVYLSAPLAPGSRPIPAMHLSETDVFVFEALFSVSDRWGTVFYDLPQPNAQISYLPSNFLTLPVPNFSNTTKLYVTSFLNREFVELLRCLTHLESLTFRKQAAWGVESAPAAPTGPFVNPLSFALMGYKDTPRGVVELPRLRELCIDGSPMGSAGSVLQWIKAPNLIRLSVPISGELSGWDVASFIERSGCDILELGIEKVMPSDNKLKDMRGALANGTVDLLKRVPNVKTIVVEDWRYAEKDDKLWDNIIHWIGEFVERFEMVPELETVRYVHESMCTFCEPDVEVYDVRPASREAVRRGVWRELVKRAINPLARAEYKHALHNHSSRDVTEDGSFSGSRRNIYN